MKAAKIEGQKTRDAFKNLGWEISGKELEFDTIMKKGEKPRSTFWKYRCLPGTFDPRK